MIGLLDELAAGRVAEARDVPGAILLGLTHVEAIEGACGVGAQPVQVGGRQTARTIHFITMLAFVLFFVVHIIMVVLANPINELRSMITGYYRTNLEHDSSGEAK